MNELNPSPELIAVALAAVAKYRDRKYPTGEDRTALCSASIILADAWSRRADDAGRLRKAFSRVRDKAVALRVAVDRVINRPRTWRELIEPQAGLVAALGELSQAEIASLPASPSAEPCQPGCVDGKMLDYNPRSGQGKEYPCPKCAPEKEDEKR